MGIYDELYRMFHPHNTVQGVMLGIVGLCVLLALLYKIINKGSFWGTLGALIMFLLIILIPFAIHWVLGVIVTLIFLVYCYIKKGRKS